MHTPSILPASQPQCRSWYCFSGVRPSVCVCVTCMRKSWQTTVQKWSNLQCTNISYGEPQKRIDFDDIWPWTLTLRTNWWQRTGLHSLENRLTRRHLVKVAEVTTAIAYDEYSQSITWNCQSRLERAVVSIWTSRVNFKTCFSRARARLCIITELCNHRSLRLSASKTIVGDLETETQVSRTPTQYAF